MKNAIFALLACFVFLSSLPAYAGYLQHRRKHFRGGGGGSFEITDTFTDTDGTNLSAHTPDTDTTGNGWTAQQDTMEISGNKAHAAGTTTAMYSVNAGSADGVIYAEVTLGDDIYGGQGIQFRRTASNDFLYCGYQPYDKIRISKRVSGSSTTLDEYTIPGGWNDYQTHTITLTMNGSSITCVLDSGLGSEHTLSATETYNQSISLHGIVGYGVSGALDTFFEDFSYTNLP